ncbi:MAG: acyltransferase [bacterium]|nr:acyltransferase [bacterium]
MIKKIFGGTRWYRFVSYMYDQWVKKTLVATDPSQLAHFGDHAEIYETVLVTHPNRVWLGDYSKIYGSTMISSMGGLHVGNYVGIGYRVTILTFIHSYRNSTTIPFDNKVMLKPVVIRDFAWVGWDSKIMPGVEIGEGAIVSMGAVVAKDVPRLAIVMGNPAEIIGYRSEDHFEKCKAEGRVCSHRITDFFDGFEEKIPLMTKRRYRKELVELGMLADEDAPSTGSA